MNLRGFCGNRSSRGIPANHCHEDHKDAKKGRLADDDSQANDDQDGLARSDGVDRIWWLRLGNGHWSGSIITDEPTDAPRALERLMGNGSSNPRAGWSWPLCTNAIAELQFVDARNSTSITTAFTSDDSP